MDVRACVRACACAQDNILGIRYGLRGFYERDFKPITLTRSVVDGIHLKGGTLLVRLAWAGPGWAGQAEGDAARAGGWVQQHR